MPAKYQTPKILHDAPLDEKKVADFHFDDFAATFARLIASPATDTPLVIGIHGAWGSGKTSLLRRVKHMLDKPRGDDGKGEHRFAAGEERKFRKCKTVWFEAWKYNEESELLVALVRAVLQAMSKDGLANRINAWLEDPQQPSLDAVAMFINAFELSFGGLGWGLKFKADPQKHQDPSEFRQHTAFFDYFNEAFERLLALWVHGSARYDQIDASKGVLVVFIDDLDRCLPEKIVQVLEAQKLFMDKHGCIFVLGADMGIVQKAVETRYSRAGMTDLNARDYLEKIIQLRFDLPLILGNAMQEHLRSQGVDDKMLSRWRALVAAAEVNPRRVKNVINDLNLQWIMARNSRQAEGMNQDDFICWQALMHAAPSSFVKQVMDFEDKTVRYGFITDALRWQQGSQEEKDAVKGFFNAYMGEDARRLRGVLRQISFSAGFTPDILDSMIYMAAPPPRPEEEKPSPREIKGEASIQLKPVTLEAVGVVEAPVSMRVEKQGLAPDQNQFEIGGLRFVRVPAGRFVMGSKDDNELAYDDERPQHTVDITYDYWMAKFVLTNDQYEQYLGGRDHPVAGWQEKKEYPVVNVSWDDATAYCQWFSDTYQSELREKGNLELRLPNEAEWEKAARGIYGNEWPWGNDFDKNRCNSSEGGKGGTTPVGLYSSAGGDSPYGCADMVGNVWEWTRSLFRPYPYESTDGREDESSRDSRVLRGGSFDLSRGFARCAYRSNGDHDDHDLSIGFRVVASPHP